jgi:PAS domain S-box-containing protein
MAVSYSLSASSPLPDLEHEIVFRALVDSVRDYAVFVLDPDGVISTWNLGAEKLQQYKADEIIGRNFSVFYSPQDIGNQKPEMALRTAARLGLLEDEGWRLRKDGSRFWASTVITRILDKEGRLLGFGNITRDLTEQRLADQRYRMLVDSVKDYAIFSLDTEGYVTSWNSGAERIKLYRADEIIGQHFSRFYTPEDAAAGLPAKVLQTARETGHYEGEGWRVRKDGTRFWSSILVTPILDESGTLSGFSKVTRDISDRKRLMDELQRHAEELEVQVAERERTNSELEAFSYSVSHDLRAPLRAIEGFANALREDCGSQLDATAHEYLSQVMGASSRMNRLVRDLLEYGRMSRMEMAPQRVPIKEFSQRLLAENFPGQAVEVLGGDAITVLAHEPTLAQIMMNLTSNAIKFHRPGCAPQVSIAIERTSHHTARITVKDCGIGIAPQHLERIFRVFERLHGIEEYPGTGIGLAIVKRGSERMGGTCGVESILGQGSSFWVELPEAGQLA